ncbi:Uncharacterised protein [Mycobacteroides abscessus subsp. abscessus]|nr:Uncharacterised protein [Mycobacteroides abscessus subsp. abscessus]
MISTNAKNIPYCLTLLLINDPAPKTFGPSLFSGVFA